MENTKMEDSHLQKKHEELRSEWEREENRLKQTVEVIQFNVDKYTEELKTVRAETKELYDNYRSSNPELHNDLVIGLSMQTDIERSLSKNLAALKKPYFGRIDYQEKSSMHLSENHGKGGGVEEEQKEESFFSLYIGKNGVSKSSTEIIVIDWRAPVASVYYDSDIGESSYLSPYKDPIYISLNLKRTFEISNSTLLDYYDTDVIANDEFLTKYLGKNKEVVLGEIIATIQKEQNDIIRDTPWHSVIVQGVAGSGKTTVAMHRISYILYNYKDRLRSDEFYIIGSNKMLLNYITGVLPNLDVYNINQMTLEEFLLSLLDKDFNLKKGKYTLTNTYTKISSTKPDGKETALKRFKGSIYFTKALESYFDKYEHMRLTPETVLYHEKEIYTKTEILEFLKIFYDKPLQEKIDLLNKRLVSKVRLVNEREQQEKEIISIEAKKFKEYFGKKAMKINLMELYHEFLNSLLTKAEYGELAEHIPDAEVIRLLIGGLQQKNIDIYDLAMLTYIKKRLKMSMDFEYVSHIIVDEAQDFGVSVFYVMKQLFKDCTYTIMGDITQNIHYDTGMNDWEALKNEVFSPIKDKFYVLAKSYRNTVEISNYASRVLKHCSFKTYDIEPIIRHGKEVDIIRTDREEQMLHETVRVIDENQRDGYTTLAIICRTIEETRKVYEQLKDKVTLEPLKEDMEEMNFSNGIMVLPIHMTKGLEFDSVILWNPDDNNYEASDGDAKLLYVAITRALHELHIVYRGNLAKLLR
ncbi:DNA helicase [Anaerocolumna cellulosilytica]|uniref:DNA helicase n=1 Tax=Anaerocolumna cellulosilytica TaxID=433286 RepID=A0A6S6RB27_9FIRM|nr:3'-5' exonuclease [Anaerocolumna cellulosilytica]MBB5195488.1 DNA helicase-2/ATP-dependent DNA helicase PcrA [Anaerocolumna cellulosilytica]BCJ96021.1 DNA helicase [Anaerocolumna cellulosilytica]